MRKILAKLQMLKADVKGSDTVEKLGMIVAAVVIICLVILAINNLFGSSNGIINTVTNAVKEKFDDAISTTSVGTGGVGSLS